MKLINAIVKSMEWSINIKKSKLLQTKDKANKSKTPRHCSNNNRTTENNSRSTPKTQLSNNDLKTDYFSLEADSLRNLKSCKKSFDLSLVLKKLQILRQILKQILNDLNDLPIFHDKTYSNICKKCFEFAYNDDRNQLETSSIIDTLMQSLGVNITTKDNSSNQRKNNSQEINDVIAEPITQVLLKESTLDLDTSTDSSDEFTSNFSDLRPELGRGTSNVFNDQYPTSFGRNVEEKNKHNFRCELILFLSMLRDVICRVHDISTTKALKECTNINFSSEERQIQKLKDEYFVILNCVTELIEGPKTRPAGCRVKRSHRRIICQLKINILTSKKHIFEILYEMCRLKRSMKQCHAEILGHHKKNGLNELPSISSQVFIKIQDICSELKNSHTLLNCWKKGKEHDDIQKHHYYTNSDTEPKKGIENYCKTPTVNTRTKMEENIGCKKKEKIDSNEIPQVDFLPSAQKSENESATKKSLRQKLTLSHNESELNLQNNKYFTDQEHILLQKIYKLLENYLEKTKEMDLEAIKDFMERETLNYNMELRRMYSLENLEDLCPTNYTNSKRQKQSFPVQNPDSEINKPALCNPRQDSMEYIHERTHILSTTDDDKKLTKNDSPIILKEKKCGQILETSKYLTVEQKPNRSSLEHGTLSNYTFDSKYKDQMLRLINEKMNDVSNCFSDRQNLKNEDDALYSIYDRRSNLAKTERFRNYHTDDDNGKVCKTSDKELLQELKKLKIMLYCLQNEPRGSNVRLKNKQRDENVDSLCSRHLCGAEQTEKMYETETVKKNFKKSKSKKVRSTHTFNHNERHFAAKNHKTIFTHQNTLRNTKAVNMKLLDKKIVRTSKDEQFGTDTNNTPQNVGLLVKKDVHQNKNERKEHRLFYKERELANKTKTPNPPSTEIQLDQEKRFVDRMQHKSKSDNNTECIKDHNRIPGQQYSIDFSHDKTALKGGDFVLKLHSSENARNKNYGGTRKKGQNMQINITRNSSKKKLEVEKTMQNHKVKSQRLRKRKLKVAASKKNCIDSIRNKYVPFHCKALNNFCHESKKLRLSSEKKNLSRCLDETNHPIADGELIETHCNASSTPHSNTLPTAVDSAAVTEHFDCLTQSNNLISGDPQFYFDRGKSKNESSIETETDKRSSGMNYTLNKITQNHKNNRTAQKKAGKTHLSTSTIKGETSKSRENFFNTIKILAELGTTENFWQNSFSDGNLSANEDGFQKPTEQETKVLDFEQNVDNLGMFGLRKVRKNDEAIFGEENSNNEIVLNETTTNFAFKKLKSIEDMQNRVKKWDNSYNMMDSFFTFSDTFFKNQNPEEKIISFQKQDEAQTKQNFRNTLNSEVLESTECDSNLEEKSERSATNKYMQAKLDLVQIKNLITSRSNENLMFILPCIENKIPIKLPTTKIIPEASSDANEPLTGFYMDYLININKKEECNKNITDPMDYRSSNVKTFAMEDPHTELTRLQKIDEQKLEDNTKVSRKIQVPSLKFSGYKKRERLKASFKRKKSKLNIKNSPANLSRVVNLVPSQIETVIEPLYPKAQLTKCFLNKVHVKELQQEMMTQSVEYDNSHLRTPFAVVEETAKMEKAQYPSYSENENNQPKKYSSKKKQKNAILYSESKDTTLLVHQTPMQLFTYNGLPLTNMRGEPLKNENGQVLVIFDKAGRPVSDNNRNIIFDSKTVPNTSRKFNPYRQPKNNLFTVQLTNEQGEPLILYNETGHPVTDSNGYSLYNRNGNPLIRFDSYGRPISDYRGNPLHTPSNREIKKLRRGHQKHSNSNDNGRLTSTSSESLLSPDSASMTQECRSIFNCDVNTQNSLAISSLRTIEDFLVKESLHENRLQDDQTDILSMSLTNQHSVSSKSIAAGDNNVKKTDKLTLHKDSFYNYLPKEYCRFQNPR